MKNYNIQAINDKNQWNVWNRYILSLYNKTNTLSEWQFYYHPKTSFINNISPDVIPGYENKDSYGCITPIWFKQEKPLDIKSNYIYANGMNIHYQLWDPNGLNRKAPIPLEGKTWTLFGVGYLKDWGLTETDNNLYAFYILESPEFDAGYIESNEYLVHLSKLGYRQGILLDDESYHLLLSENIWTNNKGSKTDDNKYVIRYSDWVHSIIHIDDNGVEFYLGYLSQDHAISSQSSEIRYENNENQYNINNSTEKFQQVVKFISLNNRELSFSTYNFLPAAQPNTMYISNYQPENVVKEQITDVNKQNLDNYLVLPRLYMRPNYIYQRDYQEGSWKIVTTNKNMILPWPTTWANQRLFSDKPIYLTKSSYVIPSTNIYCDEEHKTWNGQVIQHYNVVREWEGSTTYKEDDLIIDEQSGSEIVTNIDKTAIWCYNINIKSKDKTAILKNAQILLY